VVLKDGCSIDILLLRFLSVFLIVVSDASRFSWYMCYARDTFFVIPDYRSPWGLFENKAIKNSFFDFADVFALMFTFWISPNWYRIQ